LTFDEIASAAAALHLVPLGGCHDDDKTIILLGPMEPGFWIYVSNQPEFSGDDPMDHWSHAAITKLATGLDAEPLFPFGGAPFHPFINWAQRSGEA